MKNTNETMKPKKNRGCFSILAVVIIFMVIIGVAINKDTDTTTSKNNNSVSKFIDVTDEQANEINDVLTQCGIEKIKTLEHDELLDNAHIDGETGYRLSDGTYDNIILYLTEDNSVYRIRYNDYDLYENDTPLATLQDYTVSMDEVNKYQVLCQDKVKSILKQPSTAKFPNFTKWGWRQELNILTVQGYVDAKNDLGANVQNKFQFIIDMDTDTIQSFIFDGEELMN